MVIDTRTFGKGWKDEEPEPIVHENDKREAEIARLAEDERDHVTGLFPSEPLDR